MPEPTIRLNVIIKGLYDTYLPLENSELYFRGRNYANYMYFRTPNGQTAPSQDTV